MPSGVDGIMARTPEAPEAGHVSVVKAGGVQGRRQFAPIELRIVPRTGDGADINQSLHPVGFQKLDEFLRWVGGVPNGHDKRWRCAIFMPDAGAAAGRHTFTVASGVALPRIARPAQLFAPHRVTLGGLLHIATVAGSNARHQPPRQHGPGLGRNDVFRLREAVFVLNQQP